MGSNDLNRRELLRAATAAAGLAVLTGDSRAEENKSSAVENPLGAPQQYQFMPPDKPITAIVIGAGNRGNVYASYAKKNPSEWKIVGVAEPLKLRNDRMAKEYEIPDYNRFVTWEHVFEKPKFADVCIITTPDNLHYGAAMAAMEKGYDLLLEKPIAQNWQQCNDILRCARSNGRIVAICHVLRYSPYFRQLRHVVQSGRIGQLVSIQHLEPVEHIHMSHSFVRGNWRNSDESTPMIISKSCHDLDILRWIVGKPCLKVSSFGSLTLFKAENAPAGAPARCTDGCPAESWCPYSTLKVYLKGKYYLGHLNLPDRSDESILKAIKEGPYGRCVYRCDNNVVDHQVVNMEFADGITAAFSMEALTSYAGRRTRIFGTKGDIIGDEQTLEVSDFSTRQTVKWDVSQYAEDLGGHGGGDHRLVRDFVQAVSRKAPTLLTSTLEASMESHLMGFQAELSRTTGKTNAIELNL